MGKVWSKFRGETPDQERWKKICAKKAPTADETRHLPHFPDLHVNGYGLNGLSVVPDPSWPERYHARLPVGEFYDLQQRFTVDRVRFRMVPAEALNNVCALYASIPSAEVKEMHFVRCDTPNLSIDTFEAMLKAIHSRSTVYDMTDSEGAIRVDKCRSLGADGMVHCLFFFQNELVYEQRVNRFATLDTAPPRYELPLQNPSGKRGPVYGEKENWSNIKRGQQPPFRLYYPELIITIKGRKVMVTPDRRWGKFHEVSTSPSKVANYIQYIDCDQMSVWCPKITVETQDTMQALIANLAVGRAAVHTKRITFASGDFRKVHQSLFAQFLEPRKPYLEMIGFDAGCINVEQVRAALNEVYEEEKYRPDRDEDFDGYGDGMLEQPDPYWN